MNHYNIFPGTTRKIQRCHSSAPHAPAGRETWCGSTAGAAGWPGWSWIYCTGSSGPSGDSWRTTSLRSFSQYLEINTENRKISCTEGRSQVPVMSGDALPVLLHLHLVTLPLIRHPRHPVGHCCVCALKLRTSHGTILEKFRLRCFKSYTLGNGYGLCKPCFFPSRSAGHTWSVHKHYWPKSCSAYMDPTVPFGTSCSAQKL